MSEIDPFAHLMFAHSDGRSVTLEFRVTRGGVGILEYRDEVAGGSISDLAAEDALERMIALCSQLEDAGFEDLWPDGFSEVVIALAALAAAEAVWGPFATRVGPEGSEHQAA